MAENRSYHKNVCKISSSIVVLTQFHIDGSEQYKLSVWAYVFTFFF
jgi:hypothetical protein